MLSCEKGKIFGKIQVVCWLRLKTLQSVCFLMYMLFYCLGILNQPMFCILLEMLLGSKLSPTLKCNLEVQLSSSKALVMELFQKGRVESSTISADRFACFHGCRSLCFFCANLFHIWQPGVLWDLRNLNAQAKTKTNVPTGNSTESIPAGALLIADASISTRFIDLWWHIMVILGWVHLLHIVPMNEQSHLNW